jgi:malonyl-CoA/methylmalonyl-CoA synthetase
MFSARKAPSFICRLPTIPRSFFRMASTLPRLPIFQAISNHDPKSIAVIHSASGRAFKYGELLQDVADAKDRLVRESGQNAMRGERIAFLVENSYDYVGAQLQ